MTSQTPNGVQIDRVHSGAICTEIGEQLRISLAGTPNPLPSRLLSLMQRLDGVERGNAAFKNSIEVDLR
jgi:hypothetical protein